MGDTAFDGAMSKGAVSEGPGPEGAVSDGELRNDGELLDDVELRDGGESLDDVETGAPWAMQLALRDDRGPGRPTHLAVCEAAAAAVVLLLTDPRSTEPDGPWQAQVRRWRSGPIRKVVRRGRNIRF